MHVYAEKETTISDEIEFARAVTAVILAVKLEQAEERAQNAYDRIVNVAPPAASDQ